MLDGQLPELIHSQPIHGHITDEWSCLVRQVKYDAEKPTIVSAESRSYGLGAALLQQHGKQLRPAAFASDQRWNQVCTYWKRMSSKPHRIGEFSLVDWLQATSSSDEPAWFWSDASEMPTSSEERGSMPVWQPIVSMLTFKRNGSAQILSVEETYLNEPLKTTPLPDWPGLKNWADLWEVSGRKYADVVMDYYSRYLERR